MKMWIDHIVGLSSRDPHSLTEEEIEQIGKTIDQIAEAIINLGVAIMPFVEEVARIIDESGYNLLEQERTDDES